MGEEEAGDGFLDLSSSGSVSLERCPRFVQRLRLIPAVLSWSMLIVLVLGLAEL